METESTEPHRETFARFVRERERERSPVRACVWVCAALRNWDLLLLLLLLLYIPPNPMNLAAEMMVLHAESVRHRRVLQMRERERESAQDEAFPRFETRTSSPSWTTKKVEWYFSSSLGLRSSKL